MAYEIISQNNTVTTLADENGNVIRVPSRAVLASGTTFTVTKVNNNLATLTDSNGKVYRDVPCVAVLYGGSGGGGGAVDSVNGKTGTVVLDANDVGAVPQVETMSTPTEEAIVQYVGETDANYTNGYFYKATGTTTYTDSTTFDPASISGTTVTATAGALAGLVAEYGSGNITDIIKGTLTYDQSSDLLVFVGLDDTDTQVCTFQLYTQDYTDAGFTFTGTLADGDVINFATTISEVSTTYSWSRVDVQPQPAKELPTQAGNSGKFLKTDGTNASWAAVESLPSQTGNSGKFLTTDGTDASWASPVTATTLTISVADWNGGTTCTKTVSGLTATSVVWVAPDNASQSDYLTAGVYASSQTTDTITFTCSTTPTSSLTVNVIYC